MIFYKKTGLVFLAMVCLTLKLTAQITLKFEKISLWNNGYTAKITVFNGSADTVRGWTLCFYMNSAIKNVSGALYTAQADTHTFVHESWNKLILPGNGNFFTFEGAYTGAFSPPKEGILNGKIIRFHWVNINTNNTFCTAPASYYIKPENYKSLREIKLGQARLWKVWGEHADARIPLNRKTWAMAMVHAHQLFRNVTGVETLPLNSYFGTSLKESFCGCDPGIVPDPADQLPLRFHPSTTGDGCFQIEDGTAYHEMTKMYPQRFPGGGHAALISGTHFETAALFKAYYDIFTVRFLRVNKGWDPLGFFSAASDSLATLKSLAAAYNRGVWSNVVAEIFHSKRANALAAKNLLDMLGKNSVVWDYAKDISHFTLALSNQTHLLDTALTKSDPLTGLSYNRFYDFYDAAINWDDVAQYIDIIAVLYPSENFSMIKSRVKNAFDQVNGGKAISFRYQFGSVLDQLILSLPVDDPTNNISSHYGCIGNITTAGQNRENELPDNGMILYPNPSAGEAFLGYFSQTTGEALVEIYDVLGIRVKSMVVQSIAGENKIKIELAHPGTYIIILSRNGSRVGTLRMLISKS